MTRLAERWDNFWFAPAPPATLGFCRLAFFTGLLWLQLPFALHTWAGVPKLYHRPIWIFRLLDIPILSERVIIGMEIAWAVTIVLAAAGLFTRVATAMCVSFGFYLLALGNNFGKVGHGDQGLVITMLILALSRCGDAWSIDALLARRRRGPVPPPSGEYRWPIRMVWLLMALIFCAAGATKMVRSGFAWITSDHLAMTLIQAHHLRERPPMNLGLYLARFPLLCNVMAAGVVLLELGFPLALVSRRLRVPIVVATLLMQLGIGLLMGVWFRQFLVLYLFWVPWDRLGLWLATRRTREREALTATTAGHAG